MTYQSPNVAKPEHGRNCVVITDGGTVHLAVWRKEMGQYGGGGDFATVTRSKRTTRLDHLPDVLMWEEIRCPTVEEFSAAKKARKS